MPEKEAISTAACVACFFCEQHELFCEPNQKLFRASAERDLHSFGGGNNE